MAYGCFKEFARRATSDKLLRDKAFNIAKNLRYDISVDLLQWFINARSETLATRNKSAIKNKNI